MTNEDDFGEFGDGSRFTLIRAGETEPGWSRWVEHDGYYSRHRLDAQVPGEEPGSDESEPDYEALGYQETGIVEAVCGTDDLAGGIDLYLGTLFCDVEERLWRYR